MRRAEREVRFLKGQVYYLGVMKGQGDGGFIW